MQNDKHFDKCGFCEICKEFDHISDCLKRSYFFSPRVDYNYQPVLPRVILKKNDKSQKFRIEIAETVEANHLVLNYDQTYYLRKELFFIVFF